jgi:hypothetical protein
MSRIWKFLDGLQPCYAPDDGAGGGDDGGDGVVGEHPEFDVPEGVGTGDDGGEDSGNPPAPPQARQPLAAGGAGGRQPVEPPEETVPRHRLNEVIQQRNEYFRQFEEHRQETEKLRRFIAQALGIQDPNAPPAAKALTPREQAIQQRIFELVPWLKDLQGLAANAQTLTELVGTMPAFERQSKQYWTRVASSTFEDLESKIAPVILGAGKKAADLDDRAKARYRQDFFNWIQMDARRVERYEAIDRSLIDEFVKDVDETVVQPLRRQYGAGALQRARQAGRLPVAGNGSAPVQPVRQSAVPKDADEAADRAWENLQDRLNAGG